ncbi:MAG: hypothetical protein IJV94_03555 [Bacilli bacterium]|nr:hypothetical protein [Bacilli bacterium]
MKLVPSLLPKRVHFSTPLCLVCPAFLIDIYLTLCFSGNFNCNQEVSSSAPCHTSLSSSGEDKLLKAHHAALGSVTSLDALATYPLGVVLLVITGVISFIFHHIVSKTFVPLKNGICLSHHS